MKVRGRYGLWSGTVLQPDILVPLAASEGKLALAFASLWRRSRMMRRYGILDPGRGWQNDPLRLVGGGEAVCIPSFGAHPRRVESDISMLVPCVPRQTVSTRPRNAPAHNIWRDMQYRSAILLAQKAQGSQLDGKKGGG